MATYRTTVQGGEGDLYCTYIHVGNGDIYEWPPTVLLCREGKETPIVLIYM